MKNTITELHATTKTLHSNLRECLSIRIAGPSWQIRPRHFARLYPDTRDSIISNMEKLHALLQKLERELDNISALEYSADLHKHVSYLGESAIPAYVSMLHGDSLSLHIPPKKTFGIYELAHFATEAKKQFGLNLKHKPEDIRALFAKIEKKAAFKMADREATKNFIHVYRGYHLLGSPVLYWLFGWIGWLIPEHSMGRKVLGPKPDQSLSFEKIEQHAETHKKSTTHHIVSACKGTLFVCNYRKARQVIENIAKEAAINVRTCVTL